MADSGDQMVDQKGTRYWGSELNGHIQDKFPNHCPTVTLDIEDEFHSLRAPILSGNNII